MMLLFTLPAIAATDDMDYDALSKAATSCQRSVMTHAWSDEVKRHSAFLLDAYKEQRDIAIARADLAQRRRALHSGAAATGDTEAALKLAAEAIEDRQQALDDQRGLDNSKEQLVGYFRQLYLAQCSGRQG